MLEAKPEALEADYLPSPHVSTMSGSSFAALQLSRFRLHEQDETSQHPLHLFPSALSSFSDQQDQVWMAETAKKEEEEI